MVTRLPEIEEWCDSHDIVWKFDEAMPIDRIDLAASLANQARLEPLHDEVVDRYTAAMAAGDEFPPALAVDRDGQLVLIGGNHRIAAARRAKRATFPVYILDGPESALTLLRYEDNRRHGLPPSNDERAITGLALIRLGFSQADAARAVGTSQGQLSRAAAVEVADRRAAALGVDTFARLAREVRWRIGSIASDAVFAAAAETAADRQLTVARTTKLIDDLAGAADDHDALAIVGELQSEPLGERWSGKGKPDRTDKRRCEIALSTICSLDTRAVLGDTPTPEAKKRLNEHIRRAAGVLSKIAEGLR